MVKIHVHEAKAKFSHYARLVLNGQQVIVYRRNIPWIEFKPVTSKKKRELGLGRKRYPHWKPDMSALLEPMSEEDLKLWYDGPIFPEK